MPRNSKKNEVQGSLLRGSSSLQQMFFAEDGSQDSPRNSHAANAAYEKYDEDEEEDDNCKQELDEIPQAQ